MNYKDIDVRTIVEEEGWDFVRAETRLKVILEPIKFQMAMPWLLMFFALVGFGIVSDFILPHSWGLSSAAFLAVVPLAFGVAIVAIVRVGAVDRYIGTRLQEVALERRRPHK